jgi:hypothetical protein
MDPIVLAFGTALVGAMATSTWQLARREVIGLWCRVHPGEGDAIGAELEELRAQTIQSRLRGDVDAERAAESAWQAKLQQLLGLEPALAAELQRVLDQFLIPARVPARQAGPGSIVMTGSSRDLSTFTQIGSQTNYRQP